MPSKLKAVVGSPFNVHRVAYLDESLQWQGQDTLKQFTIGERLGKGGFAQVFAATHVPTNTKLAVKVFNSLYNVDALPSEIAILKEARHENVVSYFGYVKHKGKMYVMMEYCDAGSLNDLIAQAHKHKMRECHIAYVLGATLLALSYLHSHSIIHRDIKSANILLKQDGKVCVTDFGIASKIRRRDRTGSLNDNTATAAPHNVSSTDSHRPQLSHYLSSPLSLASSPISLETDSITENVASLQLVATSVYDNSKTALSHMDFSSNPVFSSPTGASDNSPSSGLNVAEDSASVLYEDEPPVMGGTPLFMSPEALRGEIVDFKTDVWSLGVTALEIAEGKPPHHGASSFLEVALAVENELAPTLATHAPSYANPSADFADFVQRCLVKDRYQRASVEELLGHPFICKNISKCSEHASTSSSSHLSFSRFLGFGTSRLRSDSQSIPSPNSQAASHAIQRSTKKKRPFLSFLSRDVRPISLTPGLPSKNNAAFHQPLSPHVLSRSPQSSSASVLIPPSLSFTSPNQFSSPSLDAVNNMPLSVSLVSPIIPKPTSSFLFYITHHSYSLQVETSHRSVYSPSSVSPRSRASSTTLSNSNTHSPRNFSNAVNTGHYSNGEKRIDALPRPSSSHRLSLDAKVETHYDGANRRNSSGSIYSIPKDTLDHIHRPLSSFNSSSSVAGRTMPQTPQTPQTLSNTPCRSIASSVVDDDSPNNTSSPRLLITPYTYTPKPVVSAEIASVNGACDTVTDQDSLASNQRKGTSELTNNSVVIDEPSQDIAQAHAVVMLDICNARNRLHVNHDAGYYPSSDIDVSPSPRMSDDEKKSKKKKNGFLRYLNSKLLHEFSDDTASITKENTQSAPSSHRVSISDGSPVSVTPGISPSQHRRNRSAHLSRQLLESPRNENVINHQPHSPRGGSSRVHKPPLISIKSTIATNPRKGLALQLEPALNLSSSKSVPALPMLPRLKSFRGLIYGAEKSLEAAFSSIMTEEERAIEEREAQIQREEEEVKRLSKIDSDRTSSFKSVLDRMSQGAKSADDYKISNDNFHSRSRAMNNNSGFGATGINGQPAMLKRSRRLLLLNTTVEEEEGGEEDGSKNEEEEREDDIKVETRSASCSFTLHNSSAAPADTIASRLGLKRPSLQLNLTPLENVEEQATIDVFEGDTATLPMRPHGLTLNLGNESDINGSGASDVEICEFNPGESYAISSHGTLNLAQFKIIGQGLSSGSTAPSAIGAASMSKYGSPQNAFTHQSLSPRVDTNEGSSLSSDPYMSPANASSGNGGEQIVALLLKKEDLVDIRVCGSGQNGPVMNALHLPTLKRVAVKSHTIFDKGTRHQLLHELKAYSKLRSDYLVSFLGAFHDSGSIKMATEFMDLGSLQTFVKKKGPLPENIVCSIAYQALKGLAFLHSNYQVHRDIKPDNFLLNSRAEVKIADFGLTRELTDTHALTNTFLGTLAYLSPERLMSADYSYASDIWALGLTVIFALDGKLPIDGSDYWKMMASVKNRALLQLDTNKYSHECCAFVDACLESNPFLRPNAEQLLQHAWIQQHQSTRGGPIWQPDLADLDFILGILVEKLILPSVQFEGNLPHLIVQQSCRGTNDNHEALSSSILQMHHAFSVPLTLSSTSSPSHVMLVHPTGPHESPTSHHNAACDNLIVIASSMSVSSKIPDAGSPTSCSPAGCTMSTGELMEAAAHPVIDESSKSEPRIALHVDTSPTKSDYCTPSTLSSSPNSDSAPVKLYDIASPYSSHIQANPICVADVNPSPKLLPQSIAVVELDYERAEALSNEFGISISIVQERFKHACTQIRPPPLLDLAH